MSNNSYAEAVANAATVYANTDVSDNSIVKRAKSAHDVLALAAQTKGTATPISQAQASQDVARSFASVSKGADRLFRVTETPNGDKVAGAATVLHYANGFRMVADHFGAPSKSATVVVATIGAYARAVPKGAERIKSALTEHKGDDVAAVRALDAIRRGPVEKTERSAVDVTTAYVKSMGKFTLTDDESGDVLDALRPLLDALGFDA